MGFDRHAATATCLLALLSACTSTPTGTPATSTSTVTHTTTVAPSPTTTQSPGHAALEGLPIQPADHTAPYRRDAFGQRWSDDVTVEFGHNGCDTRNDILRRDLRDVVVKPNTHDCVVLSGTLDDPYTGATIAFQRGQDTSPMIQIDHIVALANAWATGAQQWDDQTRRNFANDPRNLLAVDGPTNISKSAGDATQWLPPNEAFICDFAHAQINIKRTYGLWVTQAEHDALAHAIDTHCR